MAGVLSTGLLALVAVVNALPQAPPAGSSCTQLGDGSQVDGYTISCGTDRVGGDLSNAQSSSFSGCFSLCDNLSGCVGFTYVMNSGFCYFKSSLTATSSDANVDVAVKPVSSSTTSSVPATSTGTATSTSSAPTSTASGSCDAIGSGNVVDGYTATCNTDAVGGDLSNTQAPSFADCAPICDQTAGCIGFAYANGFCYLKSSQTSFSSNDNVDVAFKPTPSSTSSSATSTATSSAPTTTAPSTTASTTAPTTTAPSTTSSSASSSSSSTQSSSSAVPTTMTTSSTRSATSTAAPAPTGSIVNPISPAGDGNAQCSLLRQAPSFRLSAVVTRGNRALNGLFLQAPSFTSVTSPPRLVSGSANGGRYVQTNSNNWFNILPSIASVTSTGTCSAAGLALYNSNTEQGAVGLVPNIATASTVDIATTVGYVFPFQLYQFGSFYACAAPGGATLRWVQNNASNFFGVSYQSLDLTNCALVTLQKVA